MAKSKRARQKARRAAARNKLTIAVVTGPSQGGSGISVRGDVELVRAAVLYADHVELTSLGAFMLASVANVAAGDGTEILEILAELDDDTLRRFKFPPEHRQYIRPLTALLKQPALAEVVLGSGSRGMKSGLAKAQAGLRSTTEDLLQEAGAEGLLPGIEAGVVSLSSEGFAGASDTDAMLEGWLQHLEELLTDTHKRLLFDDEIARLVAAMVNERKVELPSLTERHAGEAVVGTGLIARLPAFPEAPLDELLTMRTELTGPLSRYRSAVMGMSSRLTSSALDTSLHAEVDDLWSSDVEPALQEIEESFAQHGLVKEIARAAAVDIKALLAEGAAFYVGIEHTTSMEGWLSLVASTAAPAVHAAMKGTLERETRREDASKHDLYFLYEAQRRAAKAA